MIEEELFKCFHILFTIAIIKNIVNHTILIIVLIPININTNYVYKIPVLGMYDAHFINNDWDEKIDEDYESFSRFDPYEHDNFCSIEVDRCCDICKKGYGNLIAKEYYYGEIGDNIPIYIQEKAVIYYDAFKPCGRKPREHNKEDRR